MEFLANVYCLPPICHIYHVAYRGKMLLLLLLLVCYRYMSPRYVFFVLIWRHFKFIFSMFSDAFVFLFFLFSWQIRQTACSII